VDSKSTWADVIDALQLPSGCSVLEVVARGDDSFARALYHRNSTAALITLDMRAADNTGRPLAALLRRQFDPGAFHLIALRHIIGDIVQSAVAEQEGITPDSGAGEAQPAVMRALRAYWRSGDLENTVVPRFLDIVDACRCGRSRSTGSIPTGCCVSSAPLPASRAPDCSGPTMTRRPGPPHPTMSPLLHNPHPSTS
jgi:hypothetical protein